MYTLSRSYTVREYGKISQWMNRERISQHIQNGVLVLVSE